MNNSKKDKHGKDDEVLEALFRHVSTRKRAPRNKEQRIREELHAQWSGLTRRRRLRKQVAGWAIAASVVLAMFVSTNLFRQPGPVVEELPLASVEKQLGDVYTRKRDGKTSPLVDGAQLFAGSELSTSRDSRVALSWANGASVRIDQNTRLALISKTEVSLLSGQLYIDSEGVDERNGALLIQTPSGPVQHIGTRYITAVTGNEVTVSVREGEVSVGSGDKQTIAVQGQRLHLSRGGQQQTTTILTYGEDWRWAELVAPRFNTDGRSINEFLDWVGRETGREIRYSSVEAELTATQTLMHGSVDLEPLRAMELMLQTSDLKPLVNDGVILVSF